MPRARPRLLPDGRWYWAVRVVRDDPIGCDGHDTEEEVRSEHRKRRRSRTRTGQPRGRPRNDIVPQDIPASSPEYRRLYNAARRQLLDEWYQRWRDRLLPTSRWLSEQKEIEKRVWTVRVSQGTEAALNEPPWKEED